MTKVTVAVPEQSSLFRMPSGRLPRNPMSQINFNTRLSATVTAGTRRAGTLLCLRLYPFENVYNYAILLLKNYPSLKRPVT